MKIEIVHPDKLRPHPRNSRTHEARQIAAIARSIKRWGFRQPIVANADGVVLIGHGRLEAAKVLGLTEVPVVYLTTLDPERERALIISDNRMAELSKWDQDVLGDELRWLLDTGFDLTLTAKDLTEFAPPREAEPKESPPAVSVPGDVWMAGSHLLICGHPDMPGILAAAGAAGAPVIAIMERPGKDDSPEAMASLEAALKGSGAPVAYLWHHPRTTAGAGRAMERAGYDLRGQIVVADPAPKGGGKGRYARQFQLVWYGVRKGETAKWQGGRTQSTLWQLEDAGDAAHGRAVRRQITNHTVPLDRVIALWSGDGDALISAHFTGRTCTAVEPDPRLVDATITRWENFARKDVRHANGKTFAEVREDRAATATKQAG
jgi:hypothetical protein